MKLFSAVYLCTVWKTETESEKRKIGGEYAIYMPYETPITPEPFPVYSSDSALEALAFAKAFERSFKLSAYAYLKSDVVLQRITTKYLENLALGREKSFPLAD